MTPGELGEMDPREFMNKLIGYSEQENEKRLWIAYVQAINNPYLKEKPGTFQQFCDRMTGQRKQLPLSPDKFLKIIGAL
jgi:hypothetical protein